MNIETLLTILGISAIVAFVTRFIGGWTLARLLMSFLLACLGAVAGWVAQQRLGLPELYSISFPADGVFVPVVWPTLGAILISTVGSLFMRSDRSRRRVRR